MTTFNDNKVEAYAKASEEGYFKGPVSLLGLYPVWERNFCTEAKSVLSGT